MCPLPSPEAVDPFPQLAESFLTPESPPRRSSGSAVVGARLQVVPVDLRPCRRRLRLAQYPVLLIRRSPEPLAHRNLIPARSPATHCRAQVTAARRPGKPEHRVHHPSPSPCTRCWNGLGLARPRETWLDPRANKSFPLPLSLLPFLKIILMGAVWYRQKPTISEVN